MFDQNNELTSDKSEACDDESMRCFKRVLTSPITARNSIRKTKPFRGKYGKHLQILIIVKTNLSYFKYLASKVRLN